MRIEQVIPKKNGVLHIVSEDGRTGLFDVSPYLDSEAFKPLKDWHEFSLVRNGGYFIEWQCGADLSADTIEVRWRSVIDDQAQQSGGGDGIPPPHR
jgi:hypothetical protein